MEMVLLASHTKQVYPQALCDLPAPHSSFQSACFLPLESRILPKSWS